MMYNNYPQTCVFGSVVINRGESLSQSSTFSSCFGCGPTDDESADVVDAVVVSSLLCCFVVAEGLGCGPYVGFSVVATAEVEEDEDEEGLEVEASPIVAIVDVVVVVGVVVVASDRSIGVLVFRQMIIKCLHNIIDKNQ